MILIMVKVRFRVVSLDEFVLHVGAEFELCFVLEVKGNGVGDEYRARAQVMAEVRAEVFPR